MTLRPDLLSMSLPARSRRWPGLAILLCGFLSILFSSHVRAGDGLKIDSPWIPEAPPRAQVMAAYMSISNPGQQARQIIKVSSPGFQSVEMHRSVEVDGQARMLEQKALKIAPGKSLLLQPGGYHLMLMQPNKRLRHGEQVELNLHLDNGQSIKLMVAVKKTMGRSGAIMKCAAGKCASGKCGQGKCGQGKCGSSR